MINKKEEHDVLLELDEKDLWCRDLDGFAQEWELQLKEDAEYEKDIRSKGRRASRKIGAGRTTKGRAKKEDEDFNPSKAKGGPKSSQSKVVTKVEQKPHKGFLEMFQAKPKPKPKGSGAGSDAGDMSGMSDDDFAALVQTSRAPSEQPGPAVSRGQRAAAAAPKKWIEELDEESESDDGKFLGDVGAMVKGISSGEGGSSTGAKSGRLSLFAMSRPDTSHGDGPSSSSDLPKHTLKTKQSVKTFDLSDADETNYELLAKSSPQKAPPPAKKTINSFLSDDDEPVAISKPASKVAAAKAPAKRAPKAKQPLVAKQSAPPPEAKPKPVALSPAAKAYAAKQSKAQAARNAFSEDEEMDDVDTPPAKPVGRGRPARAAVAKTKDKKPIYIESDDDDDDDISAVVDDDESEGDDFDEDSE
jgi:DNA topoisomerase II